MSRSIVPVDGTTALKAINEWPDKVLIVAKKKGEEKTFKGSVFLYTGWNLMTPNDNNSSAYFTYNNAMVAKGITAPEDVVPETPDSFEGIRLSLVHKASELGDLGKFLIQLEHQWQKVIGKCIEDKVIVINKQDIHTLVNLYHSDKHKEVEKRGQLISDPWIKFSIDFSKYSPKHPVKFLQNQQKTQFFDDATKEPSKIDGRPVDATNIHKLITDGCIVTAGRIEMASVCVSKAWVSMSINLSKAVIKPAAPAGFADDMPKPAESPVTPTVATPATNQSPQPAENVDDFLNGI